MYERMQKTYNTKDWEQVHMFCVTGNIMETEDLQIMMKEVLEDEAILKIMWKEEMNDKEVLKFKDSDRVENIERHIPSTALKDGEESDNDSD